jgi:hypothetical protein
MTPPHELIALAAAATAGRWRVDRGIFNRPAILTVRGGILGEDDVASVFTETTEIDDSRAGETIIRKRPLPRAEANAAYIAAANPTTIKAYAEIAEAARELVGDFVGPDELLHPAVVKIRTLLTTLEPTHER